MVEPTMIKVGSKEKVRDIVEHFNEQNFFYVSVKTRSNVKLTPQLLGKVFPGHEIPYNNIFLIGAGSHNSSGVIVIGKDKLNLFIELLNQNGGLYSKNGISIKSKIISLQNFRSGLNQASYYPDGPVISPNTNLNTVGPPKDLKIKALKNKPAELSSAITPKQKGPNSNKSEPKKSGVTMQLRKRDKQTMTSPDSYDKETMTPGNNFIPTVASTTNQSIPLRVNKIIQVNIASQASKQVTDSTTNTKDDELRLKHVCIGNEENDESSDDLMEIDDDKFIPVTSDTIDVVLDFLDSLDTRTRTVYVVCHTIFMDPYVSMAKIRRALLPVFDELQADSVFVRSRALAPLVANGGGWAYIITSRELCKDTLAIRAKEHQVLYGTMTMSCLISDLKKKKYLINKEALISLAIPTKLENPRLMDANEEITTS